MNIAYMYDLSGYYVGETPYTVGQLPVNSTTVKPTMQDGYIPKWDNKNWGQVENNVGKKYWLSSDAWDAQSREMLEYGPLPDGVLFEAPAKPLEQVQKEKLAELSTAFETVESQGYTVSSLGFRIDATKKSLTDVQGLILLVKNGQVQEPVMFRDYDNAFYPSSLADLQTMELEITGHGVTAYAEKWQLEAQILAEDATVESVQAVDVHTLSGYDWETKEPEAPQG